MEVFLLSIVIAVTPSFHYWFCGDVIIDGHQDCLCGDTNITKYDDFGCCGTVQCNIDKEGRGLCVGGSVCKTRSYTWQCGDAVVSSDKKCRCGEQALTNEYDQWCCHGGEVCDYKDGGAECKNGTVVLDHNTACNKTCANKYSLPCKTGHVCVDKSMICHGTHVCHDRSDIQQCHDDNNDIFAFNYRYTKCPMATQSGHQEYYKIEDKNNHEYNCLTRGDEDTIQDKVTTVNYTSITPCNTSEGFSGLMCGDTCVGNYYWCDPDKKLKYSCGGFTTVDQVLCQNKTFWNNTDCNFVLRGVIAFFGIRCTGTHQHCYYPSHRRFNYDTDSTLWKLSCKDESDQVFTTGCHNITDTDDQYCLSFCPQGRETSVRGYFFDKNTGHTVRKGTECKSKCLSSKITSQGCEDSCSGIHNFTCNIFGKEHCISDSLICDGHPACDDGLDEKLPECLEQLVKKKIIDDAATQKCISVMYRSK